MNTFNWFEPVKLNLISAAELLIVLVTFSESSLAKLISKQTNDYYYFGDRLRVPKLSKTNIIEMPRQIYTPSQIKKIEFVTKQLVSLKTITNGDRSNFCKIIFGWDALSGWNDVKTLLALSGKGQHQKLCRMFNTKVEATNDYLIATSWN